MMSLEGPFLDVRNLRCGYSAGDVIHDVSLAVGRGEIVCLIGPNGAGKSTIIKAITGQIKVRSGAIYFNERDLSRRSIAKRVEDGIALVPEGRGMLATISVLENLLMGGYSRRRETWLLSQLETVFSIFPILSERRLQFAGTLSGGEQQMLVIGRAIMSRPTLLILDEPSFGIAPKVVATIFETIVKLRSAGFTVLLVEQNASMALEISQRGYVLESGRCVLSGDTADLRASRLVQDIYLGAG